MNTLLNKLNKKKSGKKGFTLMEMLIVVAIIAILVAIAIPTFNNALNKARQATDEANLRAYYSECMTKYMLDNEPLPTTESGKEEVTINNVTYKLQAGKYSITTSTDATEAGSFVITYESTKGPKVTMTIPGGTGTTTTGTGSKSSGT